MANRIPRSIRFEEDDLKMLTETAKSMGLDFAPFVRMAAMERAKEVKANLEEFSKLGSFGKVNENKVSNDENT